MSDNMRIEGREIDPTSPIFHGKVENVQKKETQEREKDVLVTTSDRKAQNEKAQKIEDHDLSADLMIKSDKNLKVLFPKGDSVGFVEKRDLTEGGSRGSEEKKVGGSDEGGGSNPPDEPNLVNCFLETNYLVKYTALMAIIADILAQMADIERERKEEEVKNTKLAAITQGRLRKETKEHESIMHTTEMATNITQVVAKGAGFASFVVAERTATKALQAKENELISEIQKHESNKNPNVQGDVAANQPGAKEPAFTAAGKPEEFTPANKISVNDLVAAYREDQIKQPPAQPQASAVPASQNPAVNKQQVIDQAKECLKNDNLKKLVEEYTHLKRNPEQFKDNIAKNIKDYAQLGMGTSENLTKAISEGVASAQKLKMGKAEQEQELVGAEQKLTATKLQDATDKLGQLKNEFSQLIQKVIQDTKDAMNASEHMSTKG
jgi:hypothetical protein